MTGTGIVGADGQAHIELAQNMELCQELEGISDKSVS